MFIFIILGNLKFLGHWITADLEWCLVLGIDTKTINIELDFTYTQLRQGDQVLKIFCGENNSTKPRNPSNSILTRFSLSAFILTRLYISVEEVQLDNYKNSFAVLKFLQHLTIKF